MKSLMEVREGNFQRNVCRFKFIERLLLVHGHWNYDRTAKMVQHFFYKNATFVFTCFW